MPLDPSLLPALTINLEYGDTDHAACRQNALRIYSQFTAPTSEYAGYGTLEVNVSVMTVPDDIENQWWKSPDSYWMRQKVRRAVKLGYTFASFDYNDYVDDIFEINTSKEMRQGRKMTEYYRKRPELKTSPADQPCPRHRDQYFGIFREGRLYAYALLVQAGEMMQFSQILGHGDHMEDGIMSLLVFEAVKHNHAQAQTPYAIYYLQDSGTSGLQFFKRKMGFTGCLVTWELARPGTEVPVAEVAALDERRAARPAEQFPQGDRDWRAGAAGTRVPGTKDLPRIQGYTSATSVVPGEAIQFFVDVARDEEFSIAVHRIGDYGAADAQLLVESPALTGTAQAEPAFDDQTRRIECDWGQSWRWDVPPGSDPGLHLAVWTTASGWRGYAPFIVRGGPDAADLCVVLPFLTYQANNRWPLDGVRGASLALGYLDDTTTYKGRAFEVSFHRPYDRSGLPAAATADIALVAWLESTGQRFAYATDLDLHEGTVDPSAYRGLVFCGQTEYWTPRMRDALTKAADSGTGMAFLGSSAGHWHARVAGATMACYKTDPDPAAAAGSATTAWRSPRPGPARPEQGLVGIQFAGVATGGQPLIVANAAHWLWSGTGAADGDAIPGLVSGRVDGIDSAVGFPRGQRSVVASTQVAVAGGNGQVTQTATVNEAASGAVIFAAGTEAWARGLSGDLADARIQAATRNLLGRLASSRAPVGRTPAAFIRDLVDVAGRTARSRLRGMRRR